MFKAADRVGNIATLNAEDDVVRAFLNHADHAFPIDNAITTGTARGGAGYFSMFFFALLDADILGMQMYQPVHHMGKPHIGIRGSSQVAVAGVVIDPYGG